MDDQQVGDLIGDVVTAEEEDNREKHLNSSSTAPPTQQVIQELVRFITNRLHSRATTSSHSTFIIGMTGGVSVGKSTFAKQLKALLGESDNGSFRTIVISSDGFLKSNKQLETESISHRKGFPESYDIEHIQRFLSNVHNPSVDISTNKKVFVPEYDHLIYDVKPDLVEIELPDILIFEGVNVLQFADYCDLTMYIDAKEVFMREWFMTRVLDLRKKSETDASAEFYRQFASMADEEFYRFAESVWESINLKNLVDYVEPMKSKANIVVEKNQDHSVLQVLYKETSPSI
jgi:type I pantothenate kinase